jgi:hypothetical protein
MEGRAGVVPARLGDSGCTCLWRIVISPMIPQYSAVLLRFRDAESSRSSHPPLYIDGCRTGVRRNGAIVGPNGPKNAVDYVKAVTVND